MVFSRVLVLAPHTDDGEFGSGGAIARFLEERKEVYYVAFSAAEKSVPEGHPKDILRHEVKRATGVLGLPQENLILLNYQVRDFPLFRQAILEDMIDLNREIVPDVVLLPSAHDTHQDHQVVAQEGFRAFKRSTILGYECPWNNLTFTTNLFVYLSEEQLTRKVSALKCYESQAHRPYANEEFIRGWARTRGVQIGHTYAEAFEVVRWVLR